uniref:Carbamate kinase n=1 Tax=Trichomonadida sp. LN-2016a TaxID=1812481 RepID=A0A142D9Y9_9EUKA|nr:carbamate kinase [Trichomonadida sp. LN-2016a]
MDRVATLISQGYQVLVVHGNGPQVGCIFLQNDKAEPEIPAMPLHVCGAESQGFIGYLLQQELDHALAKRNLPRKVVACVTQSYVDPQDKAFESPSKPVGPFYTAEQAEVIRREKGYTVVEDAGRGYRIVVPSPMPTGFVEEEALKCLVENGFNIISTGGGGIPVVREGEQIKGINAVIDKDLGASVLAEVTNATEFMILTDVPEALINYRKENEAPLRDVSVAEMKQYIEEGHFAKGSMLPKVQACLRFVERTGKPAIITSLDLALDAVQGHRGTKIHA